MILCSTMSKLPFFTWHNILCAAVVSAVGAAFGVQCGMFFHVCALSSTHKNMHYAWQHHVRLARLPRFGEMFHWRKSSDCCFGALICICSARRRQFNTRRHQFFARRRQFYVRHSLFHSRRTRRRLLCLCHNRWQQ